MSDKEATDDLIRMLTESSGIPGYVRLPREAVNMLLAQLRARDEALARVSELHATKFYSKYGREVESDDGQGGWCNQCLRFYGAACPTMAALTAAVRGEG